MYIYFFNYVFFESLLNVNMLFLTKCGDLTLVIDIPAFDLYLK